MITYRQEGHFIMYTNESYITSCHTQSKVWSDDNFSFKKPIGEGRCLITVHAGDEMGFVVNTLFILTSDSKSGD